MSFGERGWMAAALLLLAAVAGLFQLSRERCLSLLHPTICRMETSERIVALSFDDGPTRIGVEATLPLLAATGARATYFVVGHEAERRPWLLRHLRQAGMELGNHSWSHVRMVGRTPAFTAAEIDRTAALIRASGGDDNRLFRAPNGKKLLILPLALRKRGYRLVMADVVDPPAARTRGSMPTPCLGRCARAPSSSSTSCTRGRRRNAPLCR